MFDRLGNAHAGQRDCHRYNDQTSALDCYYGNPPLWKMLKIVMIRNGAKNTQEGRNLLFSVHRTFVTPERLSLDFTLACFLWETAMHAVQAK